MPAENDAPALDARMLQCVLMLSPFADLCEQADEGGQGAHLNSYSCDALREVYSRMIDVMGHANEAAKLAAGVLPAVEQHVPPALRVEFARLSAYLTLT